MQLSSKIIRGMENCGDSRMLRLRQVYIERKEETKEEISEEPLVDPAAEAARIIGEAEEKAKGILAEAEARALQLEKEARKSIEEETEKTMQEARDQGYAEGRKEALSRAAAEASAIRDQARAVLRQAEEIRRQTLGSLEGEIVRLSVEIAEKLLVANLKLDPGTITEIAGEAISMLHNRDQVVLYVNPGEYELFQEKHEEFLKLLSPKGELHIISDNEISPGGCVAETEYGRVDARAEKRWEVLIKTLEDFIR